MNQVTITLFFEAWETLAELVFFKQQDKAFAIAKLVGHYMNDKTLALQLQADLCLFFKDTQKSKEIYNRVSELYAQSSFSNKSLAIIEHIKLL